MARTKKVSVETKKKPSAARSHRGKKKENQLKKFQDNLKTIYSRIRLNVANHRNLYLRYLIVSLVIVLIAALVFIKRDWFIAATVNNQPITTVELYQNLKARYGQEVLDQLIRDKLITQEASRQGVSVTSDDIAKKITEIEKEVGGKEALKAALTQRNITRKDFESQIKVQLLVEKILEDEISVTDKEVEDYIAANSETTKDQSKEQIRSQLKSNKLNDKFTDWYEALQKRSRVNKLI